MIISKQHSGAHGKITKYLVGYSKAETGEDRPEWIASFESLELAAIVMRYLCGYPLNEDDETRAKEALKKTDAQAG